MYTAKNAQVDAILMKTGLNNVLLPTLFTVVNNIEQYCYLTILFNIVDKCEQRGQQNIVQSTLVEQQAQRFLPCSVNGPLGNPNLIYTLLHDSIIIGKC